MSDPKKRANRAASFLEELHDIQQQALRDRLAAQIKAKLAMKAAAREAAPRGQVSVGQPGQVGSL